MSSARKHHIVPTSYLKLWHSGVGKKKQLLVLDKTKSGEIRKQAASKVARQTDFYRLDTKSGYVDPGVDPLHFENALSEIEAKAADAWRQLSERGELDEDAMASIAMFVAVWAYRTPKSFEFFRAALATYEPKDEKDQSATEWLRGSGTVSLLSIFAPEIRKTAERFLELEWRLSRPFEGHLTVADMPYVAPGVSDEYLAQGLAPGFAIPVGPQLLIVCGDWFIQRFTVDNLAREWNSVAIEHADRWLFARPGTIIDLSWTSVSDSA